MEEKILNYLANGLAASQVATLVGCSPGYISQLMNREDFKLNLKRRLIDNPATVDEKLEDKYSAVEHALVNAVQDAIPGAELPAISRALETVAKIRHNRYLQKHPSLLQNSVQVNVVQLTMPNFIRQAPAVQLNEKAEIIAINNEPMASLSADGVRNLFEAVKTQKTSIGVEL